MHVPVYISSCIHSYLIALTLSCAPRLRGRLLVFDYLTCPPLLEMSTTDVGLSKSPRFPRYRGTLFSGTVRDDHPVRDNHPVYTHVHTCIYIHLSTMVLYFLVYIFRTRQYELDNIVRLSLKRSGTFIANQWNLVYSALLSQVATG